MAIFWFRGFLPNFPLELHQLFEDHFPAVPMRHCVSVDLRLGLADFIQLQPAPSNSKILVCAAVHCLTFESGLTGNLAPACTHVTLKQSLYLKPGAGQHP